MAKTAPATTARTIPAQPLRGVARALLLIGFAFAVMADPVSSVAYTIEAWQRALHGHLHLLLETQLIVLGIIALVDVNYWQLVGRFPLGGGSAEAAARAFGTAWVFLAIGALIVDFVLTITISIAAAVSAVIACDLCSQSVTSPFHKGRRGNVQWRHCDVCWCLSRSALPACLFRARTRSAQTYG
jgi:hypothetical protein